MPLPRGYLSPSAMDTFKHDREKFIRHYFYGEPNSFESPYTMFGKKMHEALEKKVRKSDDPVIDLVLKTLPNLKTREIELRATLPSKWGDIPLLGKLDQYEPETHDFDDFKFGKRKWTQGMADRHEQLKFYQLMLWLLHGAVNNRKRLIWIETEWTDNGLRPSGEIRPFEVKFELSAILQFGNEVIRTAREISELYLEHINDQT